jgi:hypothetical protein
VTAFEANGIERGAGRLRTYVCAAAWLAGLCLVAQALVWSLASFTDMRFSEIKPTARPLRVVVHDDARLQPAAGASAETPPAAPGPIRIRSRFDRLGRDLTALTLAVGSLALVVMVLVMTVSVILVAGTPHGRLDHAVSAWMWGVLVLVLALPAAAMLRLPWTDTALRDYDALLRETRDVSLGQAVRILALFVICLSGLALAGMRHAAGIAALLLPDPHRVDPALEAEAANIKPTTLHGGRAAAALQRLVQPAAPGAPGEAKRPPEVRRQPDRLPLASQVSPGSAPRRLV